MIATLSRACYAVWLMVHISGINTIKSTYCAYFHFSIKYRRTFWSNSCNSEKIFTLQKKIIKIMAGAQPRTSGRSLFEQLRDSIHSMPVYILINELHYQ
jgi:hypothetical protein